MNLEVSVFQIPDLIRCDFLETVSILRHLKDILAQMAELFTRANQTLSVRLSVWILTRVAQIVTATHRDL